MAKAVTTVPVADKQTIRKVFPLVTKIKDAKLREGVIKAWYIAWKESSFKKLEDAPFGVDAVPGDSLVKHTNGSATGAYAMGKQLQEEYGVKINLDYVIAGALLHDLDKIVMYEKKGNKVVHSAFGEKIVHGAYGGHIALLVGLPQDIVYIIMAHSPHVEAELNSPEGKLISYAEVGKIRSLQAAYKMLPTSSSH
ncbi:MAG: HD domain-containing protein [Chloroflexota bacterium]